MRQKLQIDRKASSPEEFQNARQLPFYKRGVLEGLFLNLDAGLSRRAYAAENNISTRTLQRWIHQFNNGGLMAALEPVQHGPGRKRKVGLQEFRERILPAVRLSLRESGRLDTIKNLFQAAQSLGLMDVSYATFRRRLRQTGSQYQRRKIVPTFDEWMYHTNTGRWPRRLRAFGRRQTRQQRRLGQGTRESLRQDANPRIDDRDPRSRTGSADVKFPN